MKAKHYFFFLFTLLWTHTIIGQEHIYHRIISFDGTGITAMSEEMSSTGENAVNHALPQKNLVRHGDSFYHVFYQVVDEDVDIYLRKSADGVTWSTPVQVNDDEGPAAQVAPNLVVYEDDAENTIVVVSWDDRRSSSSAQFRTAVSTDGGMNFNASVEVSAHPGAVYCYGNLAVDAAGTLYACWYKDDGGNVQGTWFSRSEDNGMSWTPMVTVGTPGMFSEPCHINTRGVDEVFIVYSADQFNHKNLIALTSSDGGATFTSTDITTYTTFQSITQYQNSVVDEQGHIHLVFSYGETTGTITNINYTRSEDWGATWSEPVAVNDIPELFFPWQYQSGQAPSIAISPGTGDIYISWADQRAGTGNWDVYLTRSSDGGATWSEDWMLNDVPETLNQSRVSLSLTSTSGNTDEVLIMWTDDRLSTSIPELSSGSAVVFPIPCSNFVTLRLMGVPENIPMTIFDIHGRIIMDERTSGSSTVIDMKGISAGSYRIHLPTLGISLPVIKE